MTGAPTAPRRNVMQRMRTYEMVWGRHHLRFGGRTLIMGIVNVTPDSFSDGGRFIDPAVAVAHGCKLVAQGADMLDVGGESTRPYAAGVPAETEWSRVAPVIAGLARRVTVPISIDTVKASVARRALAAGASLVNDISALTRDPDMGGLVAAHGVPVILMHMRGTPRTMQDDPVYADVVAEVREALSGAIARAVRNGVARDRIIVDPGIGFGKTVSHNLRLLAHLASFEELKAPVLVGASRKAFIRKLLAAPGQPPLPPDHAAVQEGSQAVAALAAAAGAHVLRVHDVTGARRAVHLADAVRAAAGDDRGTIDGEP